MSGSVAWKAIRTGLRGAPTLRQVVGFIGSTRQPEWQVLAERVEPPRTLTPLRLLGKPVGLGSSGPRHSTGRRRNRKGTWGNLHSLAEKGSTVTLGRDAREQVTMAKTFPPLLPRHGAMGKKLKGTGALGTLGLMGAGKGSSRNGLVLVEWE